MKTKNILALCAFLIITICSCNDNNIEDVNFTTPVELSDVDKNLICQELVESQNFLTLKSKLSLFVEKLVSDNPKERITFLNNWNELYTWVDKNIGETEYGSIVEFSEDFAEIQALAQSLNQQYQVFFKNENNQVYLRKFVENHITKQEGNTVQPLTATCLANYAHCTANAKRVYERELATGAAVGIFVPIAGIALVTMALVEYQDTVRGCTDAYFACDIP
jgi:hypothetical protein